MDSTMISQIWAYTRKNCWHEIHHFLDSSHFTRFVPSFFLAMKIWQIGGGTVKDIEIILIEIISKISKISAYDHTKKLVVGKYNKPESEENKNDRCCGCFIVWKMWQWKSLYLIFFKFTERIRWKLCTFL